ncbi:MAG: type II toxin-antitoxin system RelE/ParE family toxin [Bacteroidota bacterium]
MARVTWTDQALEDLEAICHYIARDAPLYATVFANRAFESTDRLERHPLSGRAVPEVGREDIREIILGNYRIIYRVLPDEVEVLTVHHGARRLDTFKPAPGGFR